MEWMFQFSPKKKYNSEDFLFLSLFSKYLFIAMICKTSNLNYFERPFTTRFGKGFFQKGDI